MQKSPEKLERTQADAEVDEHHDPDERFERRTG